VAVNLKLKSHMAWQQDTSYGGYSNYGNYGEGQYGVDSATLDMFDDVQAETQPVVTGSAYSNDSGHNSNTNSYYNPGNAYPTTDQRPPSQQGQAYQRGPTPSNAYMAPSSSDGQPGHQPTMFNPNSATGGIENFIGNPMVTGMAMQYSQDIVGRGGEEIRKNLDKYVSIGQLKYYFAVDTSYVAKKIGVLLFPFTRSDWAIKYNQDEPVQPKYDLNAPDLYIPTMAYATYVLLVGYVLGLRNAFSPDLLASTASSTLVWLILEIGIIYLTLTVMSINTSLTKWDILSFSSYKYVGIIVVLLTGLLLQSYGYYISLIYVSLALIWFLTRTLKLRIEPEVHGMQVHGKRKLYIILMYAALQPLLIWWMTYSLVPISTSVDMNDIPGSNSAAQMVP